GPGYSHVPLCMLSQSESTSCQPADVLMRVSFQRIDPQRDYQPLAMDGHRMDRFGFFDASRAGSRDDLGGPGQLEQRHFAARHNLWMQHHVRVPDNGLDQRPGDAACQTDADCVDLSPTARCDAGTHTCGEIYVRCWPGGGATP